MVWMMSVEKEHCQGCPGLQQAPTLTPAFLSFWGLHALVSTHFSSDWYKEREVG